MKQLFFGLVIGGILCTGTVYSAEQQKKENTIVSKAEFLINKQIDPCYLAKIAVAIDKAMADITRDIIDDSIVDGVIRGSGQTKINILIHADLVLSDEKKKSSDS